MQNEDDLRGLAKTMEFMRAISILFLIIHLYWYCYDTFLEIGFHHQIVNKILLNFNRQAGLFTHPLITKCFTVLFLGLSCIGTKGVKNDKIKWKSIYWLFTLGFIFFF